MEIGVVIVTYNRIEKLKEALKAFDDQVAKPNYILVVDNACTDGTTEYLWEWKNLPSNYDKYLMISKENLGGSGGFYNGLKKAMSLEADWIWVSDDDAFPESDVLKTISDFIEDYKFSEKLSAVCATVYDYENIDLWHRRNIIAENGKVSEILINKSVYEENDTIEINTFSYVGSVINRSILKTAGLPSKDFFIFYDDTEHSLRLSQFGKIICLSNAIVHHDQSKKKITNSTWKRYYQLRNRYYTYLKHFGINAIKQEIDVKFMMKSFIKECLRQNISIEYKAMRDALIGRLGKRNEFLPGN